MNDSNLVIDDDYQMTQNEDEEEEETRSEHSSSMTSSVASSSHSSTIKPEHTASLISPATLSNTSQPHNNDSQVLFDCKVCSKLFDNVHRLQRHMLCHDSSPELRKFKCDFCDKAFKFKHHLKVNLDSPKISIINSIPEKKIK
jgi:hypothetical protein